MPSSSCFYLYTENLSLPVFLLILAYKKDTCQNMPVSLLHFFKISYPYSIKVIEISSVFTSFPYMIWKQLQPADLINEAICSGFWYFDCDENSEIVNANWSHEFRKMLGYHDTLDFPNKLESWSDLLHPQDKERVMVQLQAVIKERRTR